jgi:hypothetical protein
LSGLIVVDWIYCLFLIFQQLKSAEKSRRRMKKQRSVECLSGIRQSLRAPHPLDGLRRKAKIGRMRIG